MQIPYDQLRAYYEKMTPRIIEAAQDGMWFDPYTQEIDFIKLFTPIEEYTWHSIRIFARFPLYPQYPVGRFFADFANPFYKVAIECDGKAYHLDKSKDSKRDDEFLKMGWDVYRVSGADCNRIIDSDTDYLEGEERREADEIIMRNIYETTVDGLIRSLGIKYDRITVGDFERSLSEQCLAKRLSNPF